jgi:hypothetical protein
MSYPLERPMITGGLAVITLGVTVLAVVGQAATTRTIFTPFSHTILPLFLNCCYYDNKFFFKSMIISLVYF